MKLDELDDIFGSESRIKNESIRTQRRALRQETQRHHVGLKEVEKQLRAEAESPAGYASICTAATSEETNTFRTTISLCSVYCCGARCSLFANKLGFECN